MFGHDCESNAKKVLARVKRHMRRDVHKPADMTIRDFYQHIVRMNELEISALPPHALLQKFNTDELIDNILWGIPKSWQREMDRQGFDPCAVNATTNMTDATLLIDFCEQIEAAEAHDIDKWTQVNKKKGNSPNKKDSKAKGDDGKGKVYCEKHGWNYTHSTSGCRVLQGETRQKCDNSNRKPHGNKTWNHNKSASSTNESKKELQAFIKKQVAKGVRKELNSVSKRRKNESDDELALHALEKNLDDFNYNDMDNLKIDSDDETEVSTWLKEWQGHV